MMINSTKDIDDYLDYFNRLSPIQKNVEIDKWIEKIKFKLDRCF